MSDEGYCVTHTTGRGYHVFTRSSYEAQPHKLGGQAPTWAPSPEEAWLYWESRLLRWAADAERQAARYRATVEEARRRRGEE